MAKEDCKTETRCKVYADVKKEMEELAAELTLKVDAKMQEMDERLKEVEIKNKQARDKAVDDLTAHLTEWLKSNAVNVIKTSAQNQGDGASQSMPPKVHWWEKAAYILAGFGVALVFLVFGVIIIASYY